MCERFRIESLWWLDHSTLPCDALVDLGPPIAIEVEQRLLVTRTPIQITRRNDEFVVGGQSLGHDLATRGDDATLTEGVDASSTPAFATPTTHVPFW